MYDDPGAENMSKHHSINPIMSRSKQMLSSYENKDKPLQKPRHPDPNLNLKTKMVIASGELNRSYTEVVVVVGSCKWML